MKLRAYLDIETTGLARNFSDITIIGIALERNGRLEIRQLLEKTLTESKLLSALSGIDELYSYNGSRFDLPFIKSKFGLDLKTQFRHTDLMYDCWKHNLKGGLKAVERILRINRNLEDVDGFMAVQLWWEYKNYNNTDALRILLEYNCEDIVNLKVLREKLCVD